MLKISGAYNQLTRILSWRGWRKSGGETSPEEPDMGHHRAENPQQSPRRKKRSLRRLSKIIRKRKTKDSISKERLVTVDNVSSEEKMPADSESQEILQETRLKTTDDSNQGACARPANDAEFEHLGLAFTSGQDESDDESLLNSSGNSCFFIDVALTQPINTSIEVLEEVHTLLTDIARVNRDSQVHPQTTSLYN